MYHSIKKIIEIKPYTITVIFDNNDVRKIDFKKHLIDNAKSDNNPVRKLLNKDIFMQVQLDSEFETLYWANLLPQQTTQGIHIFGNLDFSTNMLYQISVPVKQKVVKQLVN